jgi:phosphoglucosamine mutase
VRFLSLAARTGRSVAELAEAMPRFPQVLENVRVERKEQLEEDAEIRRAIAEAERALDGAGRVLVRASGTEPIVRVMVEAETEEQARRVARGLAEVVARALA